MSIAQLMEDMEAAGAPIKAIMIAVKAIEAERAKDQERRDKRALQKREERRRATVARQCSDIEATVADSSPYKDNHARAGVFPVGISNDIPPINSPLPSEGPQAEKRKSGTCLPEDWSPPEELFSYGSGLGLNRQQTASILEDMRIWAVANRNRAVARKADWNLTAKGFIRRDVAKFNARAGPSRGGGWAAMAMESLEREHEKRNQEKRASEAFPLLSERKVEGPGPSEFDDGGLSGNAATVLIGNSFRRM